MKDRILQEEYMEKLMVVLEKSNGKNKEQIMEVIESDYYNKYCISYNTYQCAKKEVDEYFTKQNPLKARIRITKYSSKEEFEKKKGIKIQGHAIDEIKYLDNEENDIEK